MSLPTEYMRPIGMRGTMTGREWYGVGYLGACGEAPQLFEEGRYTNAAHTEIASAQRDALTRGDFSCTWLDRFNGQ